MPEEIMQRLLGYEIRMPGKLARQITSEWAYYRSMGLSWLKNEEGNCCWCNIVKLPTSRHRYCSHNCRDSAYIFCYPQVPTAKAYHLMKQSWACTLCGECYEDRVYEVLRRHIQSGHEKTPEQLFYNIGYKISREMDMDHIRPIFKGGVGIGFRNHQVICRPCHHKKTAAER